jgi:hypothetical protein
MHIFAFIKNSAVTFLVYERLFMGRAWFHLLQLLFFLSFIQLSPVSFPQNHHHLTLCYATGTEILISSSKHVFPTYVICSWMEELILLKMGGLPESDWEEVGKGEFQTYSILGV